MGDRDNSNGTIIFLLMLILGVLMYGRAAMGEMITTLSWVVIGVGVVALVGCIAWFILAGVFDVVRAVALSVWLGIVAVASSTWGGKPIFTARRTKITVGLALVSLISFFMFQHLLMPY